MRDSRGSMELILRPFAGPEDVAAVAELIAASPREARHRVDYGWRLSSPAVESGRDVQLVWDARGELVGFAAWYRWWAALDFYVRSGPCRAAAQEAIFAWAPRRFRELDAERGYPLPYWVEAHPGDTSRLALLARLGYLLDDDDFGYSMLACELTEAGPAVPPPDGFAIRPLGGEREVGAYVGLHRRAFASDSMTEAWRRRTLTMPLYQADLDLVAVAPDGQLAGFCVGWLDPKSCEAQIEPLGIDPRYQRLGLGRALLTAMLQRFREHGATRALVETEATRSSALELYRKGGFRERFRPIRKGQRFDD